MKKKGNNLLEDYNKKQLIWKTSIKLETSKVKRFFRWIWFLLSFPFVWTFYNIRDWRTAIIFVCFFALLSSEVWVPYLLGLIFHNNWLIGIGTACWLFWLGPGTPFMVICIGCTIATKGIINKIKEKNKWKKKKVN